MIRLCRLTSGLASQLARLLASSEASTCKYGRHIELKGSVIAEAWGLVHLFCLVGAKDLSPLRVETGWEGGSDPE